MLIQVEKDLPDMKHIKAVAGYILILSLCLVCAHPAHAETRRIALIHSFEPGYPPAAKALELLQKEFSLLGLDCDVREYYQLGSPGREVVHETGHTEVFCLLHVAVAVQIVLR